MAFLRYREHVARNALAQAGKKGRRVVAAFIATAFAQNDADAAKSQLRKVTGQLRITLLKRAAPWTRPRPTCWLHGLPGSPPHQAALGRSARASQRRDQAAY
jgi:hypothetical protein